MAEYYIRRGETIRGPASARRIREMAAAGKLKTTDWVRRGDDGEWSVAGSIDGLFGGVISDAEVLVDPLAKAAEQAAGAARAAGGAAMAAGGLIAGAARGLMAKAKERRDLAAAQPKPPESKPAGGLLAKLTAQNQDPKIVQTVTERVTGILTRDEEVLYVAVQAKPIINFFPDCVVLTSQRLILYRPKMLGRVDFEDYLWMFLADARLEENIIGSTLSFVISDGRRISMDYLPKDQARCLYSFAQEQEQASLEVRRQRRMEEDRAKAGGVNIQTNVAAPAPQPLTAAPQAASTPDPMATLRQLKGMLDDGLISAADFEAKKAEILKRM